MTEKHHRPEHEADHAGQKPVAMIPCGEIQELLTAYMAKELGESQSALVREHLRKCGKCRAFARDIQITFDLFANARGSEPHAAMHLSDKHRARIRRAYMHPLIGWMETHHMLVSTIVAAIVLMVFIFLLSLVMLATFFQDDPSTISPPVTILRETPPIRMDDTPAQRLPVAIPDMPLQQIEPLPPASSLPRNDKDIPASQLTPMILPPATNR